MHRRAAPPGGAAERRRRVASRGVRVGLLTREYPPEVYGGAGVHVEYLARELAGRLELAVHCMGAERPGATAHRPAAELAGANAALQTISADLSMVAGLDAPG